MIKKLPPALSIICVVVLIIAVFFSPRVVVRNPDNAQIISLEYNEEYQRGGDGFVMLENYDEKEILEILHGYKERRSLSRAQGYAMEDVQLRIILTAGNRSKEILLGDVNYSSAGNGTAKFSVIYYDDLRNELLGRLGY
ncbi:MAG: hypothetical protein IJP23_00880 [Oscillospiraceae bacterium]|nr:hypothetical protein [Oscillospiraceae bacterium]